MNQVKSSKRLRSGAQLETVVSSHRSMGLATRQCPVSLDSAPSTFRDYDVLSLPVTRAAGKFICGKSLE